MDFSQTQMQIVLCDDDEEDRTCFSEAVSELKMRKVLTTFDSGLKLMEYLNDPETNLPHILFLDINMVSKSGLQCLKDIRNNHKFKELVIAIYSTSKSKDDIEATFANGANIYITKPNEFEKLKKTIHHILNVNWQYQTAGLNRETFFLSL